MRCCFDNPNDGDCYKIFQNKKKLQTNNFMKILSTLVPGTRSCEIKILYSNLKKKITI